MIRINGLDTHYIYRDVIDIVEAYERLDMILIPKVGEAADACAVDTLVTQVEHAAGREAHRPRTSFIGGVHPDCGVPAEATLDGSRACCWSDPWQAAQTRMPVACRANALRPIDGPFGDFEDAAGRRSTARRAAGFGYAGTWGPGIGVA